MKSSAIKKMHKIFTFLVVFWGSLFIGNAYGAPFTCSELSVFARGVAVARDNGSPLYRVLKIINEDSQFGSRDKIEFSKLASKIYESYPMSPEYISDIARDECIKTGKRKH